MILVEAIANNNEVIVEHILSLNHQNSILTAVDARGLSPIAIALSTRTTDGILSYIEHYIQTHNFEKVSCDQDTFDKFKFSIYGGEFYTREDVIEIYIKPLYDESQVLELLGLE